ncbi:MAG: hypothetical protein D6820_15860 [Lentisphaerae bacterium]|nr:MAG: hypothetical protein D6820_15860 [Lentisphaerota bacterium]
MNSNTPSARKFSLIYLEESCAQEKLTQRILKQYTQATVVPVRSYKEIFNRPNQMRSAQHPADALILAWKYDPFLYPRALPCPDLGFHHVYYTTPVMNCIFSCEYCFLRGLYECAYPVIFVNVDSFFAAVSAKLKELQQPILLQLSYESDLPAMEKITGLCSLWDAFVRTRKRLTLEIRSKSARTPMALGLGAAHRGIIWSWTLSPQSLIDRFEVGCPSLEARLEAIRETANQGWPVALALDPVLPVPDAPAIYRDFIAQLIPIIRNVRPAFVTLGGLRYTTEHWSRLRQRYPGSPIAALPMERDSSGMISGDRESKMILKGLAEVLGRELEILKIPFYFTT